MNVTFRLRKVTRANKQKYAYLRSQTDSVKTTATFDLEKEPGKGMEKLEPEYKC